MRELTELQKLAYDARFSQNPPLSYQSVGVELGMSRDAVSNLVRNAVRKIGVPHGFKKRMTAQSYGQRFEVTEPSKAAHAIELLTQPGDRSIASVAEEAGISPTTARRLDQRLEHHYPALQRESERVQTDTLVRAFEKIALSAVTSITEAELKKASPSQRMVIAAIATDKRELLDGRPTERISMETRAALPDLMDQMLKEAHRRGLIQEIDPVSGRVKLIEDTDAPIEVQSGLERNTGLDFIDGNLGPS